MGVFTLRSRTAPVIVPVVPPGVALDQLAIGGHSHEAFMAANLLAHSDVHFAMSPFTPAEKVSEPLLMIHGRAYNNSGTFPMQSERFYAALKELGGTVRLVMLPEESHGYRARESVLHMLWESERWLDAYVKNAPPRESGDGSEQPGR
jgi:dipeptidyl aminopeptidase/acylaminoacyl peptidase